MSTDIEKLAVFDDRIVQTKPKYAVEKGALSVTNAPYRAIANNASQMTFNILVPSENVFIDRAFKWTSTCYMKFRLTNNSGGAIGQNVKLVNPGKDFALAPFPLHQATTTITATINDTTVTINSQDVLEKILRLTDYKKNRSIRTCPTMLDKYVSYNDAYETINSPLGGWQDAKNVDEVGNGAWWNLYFSDDGGNIETAYVSNGFNIGFVDGCPVVTDAGGLPDGDFVDIYFQFTSTENLTLSPFVYADAHEWDTGLFGCQNIQLIMNFGVPSRLVRWASVAQGLDMTNVAFFNVGGSPWGNPLMNIQYLTPSLDVALPPKSVVPYMEFPRFISANLQNVPVTPPGQPGTTLVSQTITLPTIPDLLIIFARDSNFSQNDNTVADYCLPVTGISVNFDNFAGLLSAHTQQQLYEMTTHNGLEMDYSQWSGQGWALNAQGSSKVPLVGGPLILKPGRDIVLQAGQAPGLVGNFVLQFNLTVANYTGNVVTPQIVVITANSGFFETIKGSSRVIKGVLTEQDIISAPVAPSPTQGGMARLVGGRFNLSNAMTRLKEVYQATKPAVTCIKGALGQSGNPTAGRVANALGAVGYGRGKKSHSALADRLM